MHRGAYSPNRSPALTRASRPHDGHPNEAAASLINIKRAIPLRGWLQGTRRCFRGHAPANLGQPSIGCGSVLMPHPPAAYPDGFLRNARVFW